jgi:hypothetical protein
MLKLKGKSAALMIIFAVLGLLQGILLSQYLFPGKPNIPPQTAIAQALKNTGDTKSYEYVIKKSTVIDGKAQVDSNVKGEKQDGNNIHIKGQIFGADLDYYQIGETSYSKDQMSGEWVSMKDSQLNQQEIFMGELNPLANFTYKELTEANFSGYEKISGKKYLVYTALPITANPYMDLLWRDFSYKLWIEPRSLRVFKAQIMANGKGNTSNKLKLEIDFSNYNSDIVITPPR